MFSGVLRIGDSFVGLIPSLGMFVNLRQRADEVQRNWLLDSLALMLFVVSVIILLFWIIGLFL